VVKIGDEKKIIDEIILTDSRLKLLKHLTKSIIFTLNFTWLKPFLRKFLLNYIKGVFFLEIESLNNISIQGK
jgi:hypothetical protein